MNQRPYPVIRKAGFQTVFLGAGYAYCKNLPAERGTKTVPAMVYFRAAGKCGDGRVKEIDEQCIVYLDIDGEQAVKTAFTQNVPAAIELADKWAGEAA